MHTSPFGYCFPLSIKKPDYNRLRSTLNGTEMFTGKSLIMIVTHTRTEKLIFH